MSKGLLRGRPCKGYEDRTEFEDERVLIHDVYSNDVRDKIRKRDGVSRTIGVLAYLEHVGLMERLRRTTSPTLVSFVPAYAQWYGFACRLKNWLYAPRYCTVQLDM